MTTIKITQIEWDTDGESVDLPKSVTITVEDWATGTDEAQIEDWVSDYLSDEYGYCHHGFDFEVC